MVLAQAAVGKKNKTDNEYDVYNETYTEKVGHEMIIYLLS